MNKKRNPTILVIGAGPAGSVAASYLQKNGYHVLVVEKDTFPRFVIGESLLPRCMDVLEEAGLIDAVLDCNFQKKTGAAFFNNGKRCDFNFKDQYAKSWGWTWQMKRAEFDQKLMEGAQQKGVDFLFETEVVHIDFKPGKQITQCKTKTGETLEITSDFIFDASGYGRVLPRLLDLNTPVKSPERGAVFAHYKDDVRGATDDENNIIVHSFNQNKSWLWCIPFSDNTTSVGLVTTADHAKDFAANEGEKFKQFIEDYPAYNGRFKAEQLLFEPKSILGYSVGVKQMFGPGYVLCGNSTEFLDPIFSSGATLAMESGLLAAKLYHATQQGKNVNWQTDYEDHLREGIDVFRSYVDGWYNGNLQTIFFNKEIDQGMKEQICSVLAGHVWDSTNPFIKKHKTIIKTLATVIKMAEKNTTKTMNSPKTITALEAITKAQEIAFSPMVFQATRCLLKFGVLEVLSKNKNGLSLDELHEKTNVSTYGLGVLLEMAQVAKIVSSPDHDHYQLDKTGYFLLSDSMTTVNFNFVNDVCYNGLFYLDEAIETGTPAGLKVLGDWDTIYQGLSILPEPARTSWFDFDHFYSDGSFDEALDFVFKHKPKHILDIGGNTGKWSIRCCNHNPDVNMSILDLPVQLRVAQENLIEKNLIDRVALVPTNVLIPDLLFPKADAIWMSQFLDCFSEQQVVDILSHAAKNMDENTNVFIMETFWDNQKHDAAKFSLAATSLYFTAMANGNSKMYGKQKFTKLIEKAGLKVVEESGMVGISHTILRCRLAR